MDLRVTRIRPEMDRTVSGGWLDVCLFRLGGTGALSLGEANSDVLSVDQVRENRPEEPQFSSQGGSQPFTLLFLPMPQVFLRIGCEGDRDQRPLPGKKVRL